MAVTRHDRIVLRALSPVETIGGAVVLDPQPPVSGLRRAGVLGRFERLDAVATDSPEDEARRIAAVWLVEADARGLDAEELATRGGLDRTAAARVLAHLAETGGAVASAGRAFDAALVRAIEQRVVDVVTTRHRADALDAGVPREAVRESVASASAPGLFEAVIERLAAAGTIAGTDRLVLAAHRPVKTPAEARACELVEAAMRTAGLAPPDQTALGATTGLAAALIARAQHLLLREQRLARLGDLVFHVEALAGLKADVRRLGAGRATNDPPVRLDVATIKQRYGLSRKFAIPLLEWLDRERMTRRVGDSRIVL